MEGEKWRATASPYARAVAVVLTATAMLVGGLVVLLALLVWADASTAVTAVVWALLAAGPVLWLLRGARPADWHDEGAWSTFVSRLLLVGTGSRPVGWQLLAAVVVGPPLVVGWATIAVLEVLAISL